MPTELRRIIFTEQELIDALTMLGRAGRLKLPAGELKSCKPKEGGEGVSASLEIFDMAEGKTHSIELASAQLGAALIMYCLNHKIPLAKGAEKSIQIVGENLSLCATMRGASQLLSEKASREAAG